MKDDFEPEYIDLDESIIDSDESIEELLDLSERPTRKRKEKKDKKTNEYINKDDMWLAFKEYYDLCEKNPDSYITEKLAKMISDIPENMKRLGNFNQYSWLEEMVGDAKIKMFKAVKEQLFSLNTRGKVLLKHVDESDGRTTVKFEKMRNKKLVSVIKILGEEDSLEFDEDGNELVVFKNNPFGFYSRICWNCFINRIKDENKRTDTHKRFQEEMYEKVYASESWKNVRRQKIMYDDDVSCENNEE